MTENGATTRKAEKVLLLKQMGTYTLDHGEIIRYYHRELSIHATQKDGFGVLKKKSGETLEQMWTQGKLLKEHKLAKDTDRVLETQLERITSDIKNDILLPLQEKTRVQQDQIDKLKEKLTKQKESYEKELQKSQVLNSALPSDPS